MSLTTDITAYLRPAFHVCDASLAALLAHAGQQHLLATTGLTASQYSIANCLSPSSALTNSSSLVGLGVGLPQLELPEGNHLTDFYAEHGLEPLLPEEVAAGQVAAKLQAAWQLLASVPAVAATVRALVKTIQPLRSPDPEIDISHSHPAIPFSVFVTVGEDGALISSLRVAESLLHEAMHLKLTLLEQQVALIHPASQRLYYSPWRDEDRPARGVLHGMFVFAAVREFYQAIQALLVDEQAANYVADRIETISHELRLVRSFATAPDLTAAGQVLADRLLSLETAVESR